MYNRQELRRIKQAIKRRTDQHYLLNKKQASLHNWFGRCMALIIKGRAVWPPISKRELEAFYISSGCPRKYWSKKHDTA